ncbi:Surface antigen [Anaplasma phagocytophilum]|nr:Surface antigen [Anaplasma phagocytophilum]
MLVAMEGSVGYGIGGARVELEIGYERFKTKGIRDSGSKEDEADTVYLLAKELAYDVVSGQTDNLAAALAKYKGGDIVRFAETLGISHDKINKKICDGSHAQGTKEAGNSGVDGYAAVGEVKSTKTAQCSGLHSSHAEKGSFSLTKFIKDTKVEEDKNWPAGHVGGAAKIDTVVKANSNAEAVATDLTKLTPEEKTIVAGLLAKTIEGGEVVEIRAVSSTSVMVNAEFEIIRLFRRESEF